MPRAALRVGSATACLVARCVRGIEEVLAEEVRELGTVEAAGHREVRFTACPGPAVLGLATADDVFVIAADVGGIGRARAGLGRLRRARARAAPGCGPPGPGPPRRG